MGEEILRVRMLGEFSLTRGNVTVSDHTARPVNKAWLLLSYLIYNRNRLVS